jgi:hypothetical protein
VAHVDVAAQVELGRGVDAEAGHAFQLAPGRQHALAVAGEVEVRPADAAGLDLHQHLPEGGLRLGDVVAHEDAPGVQHRRPHQTDLSCTCDMMACPAASPAPRVAAADSLST